jgi:hypothetical protein
MKGAAWNTVVSQEEITKAELTTKHFSHNITQSKWECYVRSLTLCWLTIIHTLKNTTHL